MAVAQKDLEGMGPQVGEGVDAHLFEGRDHGLWFPESVHGKGVGLVFVPA